MSQIVTGKKSRKKQSVFEKLWARAAKLRAENARFTADLDVIVERMENTVKPVEADLARSQLPLLQKLLTLGQRKSMTNWEREELDDWIRELLGAVQGHGHVNDSLMNDVARYDAFRMGIALEDDSIPPHEQFAEVMKQAEEERVEAVRQEEEYQEENREILRDILIADAELDVEKIIDSTLGPEPLQPEKHAQTNDLWADELDAEQQRLSDEYHKNRADLRERLMEEKTAEIDAMLNGNPTDEEDDFDFGDFDYAHYGEDGPHEYGSSRTESSSSERHEALSNDTFQRLFRATAGKLHPDRESDPEVRLEKQRLMANLLNARKKGDVMTILEMYETYVGEHEGFSKADQKALTDSLKQMVTELEEQHEEIAFQSPLHALAYQFFYSRSRKQVDLAFAERLQEIKQQEKFTAHFCSTITSLKTLKPELDARYQAHSEEPSFDDFLDFMENERPF